MNEENIYQRNRIKSIVEKCGIIILLKIVFLVIEAMVKLKIDCNYFGEIIVLVFSGIGLLIACKVFLKIDFSDLLQGLKPQKSNCIKNMQIALFYIVIGGVLVTALDQLSFMIHSGTGETVDYFLKILENSKTVEVKPIVDIVMYICFFILAAAIEEIFFRYTFYKAFVVKDSDKILFLVISSLIFGLFHIESVLRFIKTTVLGFSFGITYIKTQKWIYTFTIHFLWNVLLLLMPHYAMANIKDMSATVFITGGATIILSLLLFFISLIVYFKRNKVVCEQS